MASETSVVEYVFKEVDELPVTDIVCMKGCATPSLSTLKFKIPFWYQYAIFVKSTLFKEMVTCSTLS